VNPVVTGLAGLDRLSRHNPTVAKIARWQRDGAERRRDGVAIVESLRALEGALDAGAVVEALLVCAAELGSERGRLERVVERAQAQGAQCSRVEASVLERLRSTKSSQGLLAVLRRPVVSLAQIVVGTSTLLVLAGVADPGNVGTLVRSAAAAGLDGVVVCRPSADPFGAKAVRASAGALWGVSVAEAGPAASVLGVLRPGGFACLGTSPAHGRPPAELPVSGRVALVLGSEAHGTEQSVAEVLDDWVRIPMAPRVDSLNVAMAGTLVAFALGWRRGVLQTASGESRDQR
jgi:TrmH family RNA methyltransferase